MNGLGQPYLYEAAESVAGSAVMLWQIPNESGDPMVPVTLRSMSMESLIAQVSAGGISVTSPLVLSSGVLSISGLSSVGSANQVVGSNGSSWTYINSTGSGNIVRAASPTLSGTAVTANLTVQGNLLAGNNTGQSIALGGANDLVGLFGKEPVAQPSVNFTSWANPVTSTGTFMNQLGQLLQGLFDLGVFKVS